MFRVLVARSMSSGAPSSAKPSAGFMDGLIARFGADARRRSTVEPGARWKAVFPTVLPHLCIGAPYAWSLMAEPLSRDLGVVTAAAGDWGMATTVGVMSVVFATQGITSSLGGSWQEKVGPTIATAAAGISFGAGMMLTGLGVVTHNLPLVYIGYGVLGGIGVGLAYTPPLQTLMEYFPDRKPLASGITIAGFGSGPLVFAPIASAFCKFFSRTPEFVGREGEVATVVKDGVRYATHEGGGLTEVVLASAKDLAAFPGLAEGFYAVGSGSTGVGPTLVCMGGMYMAVMVGSALSLRKAPVGYSPGSVAGVAPVPISTENVHFNTVMKTPQFWALFSTFFCVAGGGMAVMSVAKPLMLQTFSNTLPEVVTPAVASGFVLALSLGNLGGRLAWPALAQKVGYRKTVQAMTLTASGMFLVIPTLIEQVAVTKTVMPLVAFSGSSFVIVTILGGIYALLPAYESYVFGGKYVGGNHGRMLLASTSAALAGPGALLAIREREANIALDALLAKVDPAAFAAKFGIPITEAHEAIQKGTVTIQRLLDITPGVADPSIYLYNSTMYTMGVLMLVAAASHQTLRPIDPKYYEVNSKI
jgi:MFS family permease